MAQSENEPALVHSELTRFADAHRFSHGAMATTFEVIVQYEDALYARQAANAAFDEVDRLEREMSRYIENSDVSRISNLPTGQPVPIGPDTFDCLRLSAKIHAETNHAFDVTVGLLLSCWRNEDKSPRTPSQGELEFARQHTGTHLLKLDPSQYTVELLASPLHIDLGGIGKGFAVDHMAELLREWSIGAALIHGGFSSVLALDPPTGTAGWPVTLSCPGPPRKTIAKILLRKGALSASGLQKGLHIIDPRTAQPVQNVVAAWSRAPDAATADALSTAFMIMSVAEIEQYCLTHPDTSAMVVPPESSSQKGRILRFGPWNELEPLK